MWVMTRGEMGCNPSVHSVEDWVNTDSIDSMRITYSPEENSSGRVIVRLALEVVGRVHNVTDTDSIHAIIEATLNHQSE